MSEQEAGDEHFGPHALLVPVAEEPVVPQALESHQDVNGLTIFLKWSIMLCVALNCNYLNELMRFVTHAPNFF